MNRNTLLACALALALLALPATAQADFGIVPGSLSAVAENRNGTIANQAGSHPYDYTVNLKFNIDESGHTEGGIPRDIIVDLPPGFLGNPQAVPRCPRQKFEGYLPDCPVNTQVAVLRADLSGGGESRGPVYNLVAPPGMAGQLGFGGFSHNALQNASVRSEEGYGLEVGTFDVPLEVAAISETIWGVPADPGHDAERGQHAAEGNGPPVASDAPLLPFLTLPTSCDAPPQITIKADSNLAPGVFDEQSAQSLDGGGNPAPLSGCDAVPFSPGISATPTTKLASNGSGLDFELKLPNQGLLSPGGITETEPSKMVVTLPEGVTANPSLAEGIGVCSEEQMEHEKIDSGPGQGCPESSKLGSITAHSPLLEEPIEGALYLATPYENPFGTLIGLYLVARAPERGVLVKQSGKVEPDPRTGQLVTSFDELPPLPYSDVKLHFREGARSPLITPPGCGEYKTTARLTPFSAPNSPIERTASFQIERGPEGGPCPPGGGAPFHPGFEAGSINNNAAAYSPFYMRLTRKDGEQDMTKFSTVLPPGLVGRIAGVAKCSEAQIARARSRTGRHGAREELADPSCPAASAIGRTLAGAGVGSQLTYVPGSLYLAGPIGGDPLSVVAIVPALAGPFDAGTVVVREALTLNPQTAEVEVDGAHSEPIPHVLKGIPLNVRDLRVYADKPSFTLNPTNCNPFATRATLWGGGTALFPSGESPFGLSARYQAANCAALGFAPNVAIALRGGTKRGKFPALTATVTPRPGDANFSGAVVTLPHSEFLEQGHFGTICTRVQFAAGGGNGAGCPAASIYGTARASSPLIDETLSGPVYLRSSNHNLPDLVVALHGIVNIDLAARIDSRNGGIRSTFEAIPDAPVSKFVLELQGAKKGLIVNSTDLCNSVNRAKGTLIGQNGRAERIEPVVSAKCPKGHKRHKRHRKRHPGAGGR